MTLEPLQIDGGFRRITVSTIDPDGHPVADVWIGFVLGNASRSAPADDEGRLTVLLPPEGADLQVADPAW